MRDTTGNQLWVRLGLATPQDVQDARLFTRFDGRVSRRTWWIWGVFAMLGLGVLLTALLEIADVPDTTAQKIVNVALLWPTLAISAKRWHDRGKSSWWLLINLIPLVGWLWAVVENGLLRGSPGPNRFGPAPDDRPGAADAPAISTAP